MSGVVSTPHNSGFQVEGWVVLINTGVLFLCFLCLLLDWFACRETHAGEAIYFLVVFLAAGFFSAFSPVTLEPLGMSTEWMLGRTPPCAIVTPPNSLLSSSSLRTASWMWRGMMRVFLLSRAALPASWNDAGEKRKEGRE